MAGPKSLYVLPDFHARCLNIMPAEAMAQKLDKIRRHSMSDRKAMDFARRLGAVSELVMYPQDGHGIRRYPSTIDVAARIVDWFDRYLA